MLAQALHPDAPEAHSYEAAQLAAELREQLLLEGRSFCFETVFSHSSKIDFAAKAKALGYQVVLVVIHVDPVSLNHARIAQRVRAGGHDVPADKVESRIPRTLNNLKTALPLCDAVLVLDNSSAEAPFRLLATLSDGQAVVHAESLPSWAEVLLLR